MYFQRGKPDHPGQKTSPSTIDTVFCSTPIHASKQKPKIQKNCKMCKITSFKAKKGKNKYNTIGWQIKRSQYLKIHFAAIYTKTLIGYGQKVDFLIRPFIFLAIPSPLNFCHPFNFLAQFSSPFTFLHFHMFVYTPK